MTEQVQQKQEKKRSNWPLWALIIMSAFPYVGATLYYQYIEKHPGVNTTNYGTILSPVIPVENIKFENQDATQVDIKSFQKKWSFLYFIESKCDDSCKKDLYYLGQIRKAVAKDRYRINRLIVLQDSKNFQLSAKLMAAQYSGAEPLLINEKSLSQFKGYIDGKGEGFYNRFYLIDPIGNLMMIYPQQADPYKILKDIKKLLKVSRIG